ncbi:MAG TPA: ABC transporter permease [Polyangiaceae bacterium]|nr:ABC transporter permease [Polyangiaceae bacterium]
MLLLEGARSLLRHKVRAALSAFGIAIAVAAVVWVVALATESARQFAILLDGLGDNLIWVEAGARNSAGVRTGAKTATTLTIADMEAIARDVPLIRRISPQVDGSVAIVSAHANWTTRARGIRPDYLPIKRYDIAAGDIFSEEDVSGARNVMVIGRTVQEQLFRDESPVGASVRVNGQPFVVVGVLAPKGQSATGQDMDDVVMVPYTTAIKKLRPFGMNWVDDIVCSAESRDAIAPTTDAIASLMRERHRSEVEGEDDFNIRHPEEVVNAQMEAAKTFSTLLVAVAVVSLLVGGIGVMNVMLATVTERTREIGLRIAVGARPWHVRIQFLLEGILLCVAGGLLGVAISFAGSALIGHQIGWSLTIRPEAVVLGVVMSTLIGIVFGSLPAWRASKLDPITALRDE